MSASAFELKVPASREAATAIIERLTASMARRGPRFDPYSKMDLSPAAIEQLARARLGMLAMDFFAGRLKEQNRREAGRGLALAMHQRLGTGEIYALSLADSDIAETVDSFWELLDRILLWLKQVGGVAGGTFTAPIDICVAASICIYYFRNPPTPPCPVTETDKWRHCYVGCKLGFWVPNGFAFGVYMALLKELADAMGLGTAELEDFVESVRGVGACGFFQSCEDCCCEKGY